MQSFVDQARKNGVTLFIKGNCQFCGADYQKGIFECMDHYNTWLGLLDFSKPQYRLFKFLSVDAHALQHPEIHGRWSNHFHLARLHLILERKQQWDYKMSPLLSDFLNEYKSKRPLEFLSIPKPLERGKTTAKHLTGTTTAIECVDLIKNWAEEVYFAWSSNLTLVSQIADGFLARNDISKIHENRTKSR